MRIKPKQQLEKSMMGQETWKSHQLDTKHHVMIYPRVSTPDQMLNVSSEMQQDKSFALAYGWKDELILMDTSDLGLSGRLRMEERPAFTNMLRLIEEGKVKTIIVAQVDRLFRDRWGQEYGKFMEICFTYGVKVATLSNNRQFIDFIYDFSIPWHVENFRKECEASWRFMEKHIYRMVEAKKAVQKSGRWGGGVATFGYIPDLRKFIDGERNPHYRHFEIYPPHAAVIIWLFERFRELTGSVKTLMREIASRRILFESFNDSIPSNVVSCYANTKVLDEEGNLLGYTISTHGGLSYLLSNPIYIGVWMHAGKVERYDNHPAIVDKHLFMYAFNRLSPTFLDGSPNPEYQERLGKYAKRHFAERPASLKDVLSTPLANYKAIAKTQTSQDKRNFGEPYMIYAVLKKVKSLLINEYSIPAREMDGLFFQCLKEKLLVSKEFDNFQDYSDHEKEKQLRLTQDIERDIKATKSAMDRILKQVTSGELTNPTLLQAANTAYSHLEDELARLRERQMNQGNYNTILERRYSYQEMIKKLYKVWEDIYPPENIIMPEELPLLVEAFVKKVDIIPLSPYFYELIIYWRDPDWGIGVHVCHRSHGTATNWSKEEDDLLRANYPIVSTREELMEKLPIRTYVSILRRIGRLKLKRNGKIRSKKSHETYEKHTKFSMNDCLIVDTFQLSDDIIALREARVVWSASFCPAQRGSDINKLVHKEFWMKDLDRKPVGLCKAI